MRQNYVSKVVEACSCWRTCFPSICLFLVIRLKRLSLLRSSSSLFFSPECLETWWIPALNPWNFDVVIVDFDSHCNTLLQCSTECEPHLDSTVHEWPWLHFYTYVQHMLYPMLQMYIYIYYTTNPDTGSLGLSMNLSSRRKLIIICSKKLYIYSLYI